MNERVKTPFLPAQTHSFLLCSSFSTRCVLGLSAEFILGSVPLRAVVAGSANSAVQLEPLRTALGQKAAMTGCCRPGGPGNAAGAAPGSVALAAGPALRWGWRGTIKRRCPLGFPGVPLVSRSVPGSPGVPFAFPGVPLRCTRRGLRGARAPPAARHALAALRGPPGGRSF